MDLGLVAHLASLRSSVPFVHFFDGTSLGGRRSWPADNSEAKPGGNPLSAVLSGLDLFFGMYQLSIYVFYIVKVLHTGETCGIFDEF